MKYSNAVVSVFLLLGIAAASFGQRPEVSITLNEAFFDALLDSVFQSAPPLEFSIASAGTGFSDGGAMTYGFANRSTACKQVIRILRENNGVRTAVRFREGKILAPLAFTGNYSPPFVGCVPFSGFADTVIDLGFDQQNQRLIANARVLNVSLNGTGGVGGALIAKLVQSSIDRKINPIEIFRMEKLSFPIPVQNADGLRMKAAGVRHDIEPGALRIHISYEFIK